MMYNKHSLETNKGDGVPFERIRRITGYLTGNLEGWNSAKRSEERDRVKHGSSTDIISSHREVTPHEET